MTEFFRGWKRKVGLLTLLMALTLMGAWIRSLRICDTYYFTHNHSVVTFRSVDRWVGCRIGWHPERIPLWYSPVDIGDDENGWTSRGGSDRMGDTIADGKWSWPRPVWNGVNVHWNWELAGFRFYSATVVDPETLNIYCIPYWSLVLPLTAFAAYLLLTKPNPSALKTSIDPLKEEEATS